MLNSNSSLFPIKDCQKIILPQGAIYIGPSNEKQSVGYLELQPHSSLNLHHRPAIEKLTQVKGEASLVIYHADGQTEVVKLKPNDYLEISPANTWHIHVNHTNQVCLQYWDFAGDIREIIEAIRKKA